MVRDTSASAFAELGDSIKDKVKRLFGRGHSVWTRREIANELGVLPGSIPAAVSALIEEGFLMEMDTKYTCQVSGRKVYGVKRDDRRVKAWQESGPKAEAVLAVA